MDSDMLCRYKGSIGELSQQLANGLNKAVSISYCVKGYGDFYTTYYPENKCGHAAEQTDSHETQRSAKVLDTLIRFIHVNLHEDLSLARLSKEVNYNPAYLSRIFKQVNGVKLSEYILYTRIEKSKELLKDAGMPVNKAAKLIGYDSAHSFARTFKSVTGCTPREYKNSKLRNQII